MIRIETSLSRKIAVSFSIAFLVSIAMGVVSYWNAARFVESTENVARTYRGMTLLQALLADTVSAESGVRGYIITGQEEFLNLYRTSLTDVDSDLAQLGVVVKDPVNRAHLDELARLTGERLKRLEATLATFRSEGIEAVRTSAGPGKKLMDNVRRVADLIEARQNVLLDQRGEYARSLASRTILAVIVTGVLAALVAAAGVVVLTSDVKHRERLEKEVIGISEREQRRIGQDLHDGVCQQMTGISLLSRSLQQRLSGRESAEAGQIVSLLNDCIEQTRLVTRGLHPVPDEPTGLMLALEELAGSVNAAAKVACRLDCPEPVTLPDQNAATNLYRIAQEAVQNALRHAEAASIVIGLRADEENITLTVTDDGRGIPAERPGPGIGLDIMRYRARTIGANLEVRAGEPRGTVVKCSLSRASLG